VIRCFCGEVGWDGSGSKFNSSNTKITHQIVDKGAFSVKHLILNRVYIVPQYIYDCINSFKLLPAELYHPTVTSPPHLSPFHVQPNLDISSDTKGKQSQPVATTNTASAMEEDTEQEENNEKEETEAIISTNTENTAIEEKELAKIMMTKKNKWLYKRMQYGIRKEDQKIEKLKEKKRAIQQGKPSLQ